MRQLGERKAQKWLDTLAGVPTGTRLFELKLTVRWLSPGDFAKAHKLAQKFSDQFSELLPNGSRDRVEGYVELAQKAQKGGR